jgi:hypothetical protein
MSSTISIAPNKKMQKLEKALLRGYLVLSHVLPSQSVASHKSVAATKSVAEKYEAKL